MLQSLLSNGWIGGLLLTIAQDREVGPDPGIDVLGMVGAVAGWIFGACSAFALIFTAIKSRRSSKETVEVSEKSVEVQEKDVQTRAVAQVIEALTEGLNELRTELKEQKGANVELQTRVGTLETQINLMRNERFEMIEHIEVLESRIPTPPGPPARPGDWDYIAPR